MLLPDSSSPPAINIRVPEKKQKIRFRIFQKTNLQLRYKKEFEKCL